MGCSSVRVFHREVHPNLRWEPVLQYASRHHTILYLRCSQVRQCIPDPRLNHRARRTRRISEGPQSATATNVGFSIPSMIHHVRLSVIAKRQCNSIYAHMHVHHVPSNMVTWPPLPAQHRHQYFKSHTNYIYIHYCTQGMFTSLCRGGVISVQ